MEPAPFKLPKGVPNGQKPPSGAPPVSLLEGLSMTKRLRLPCVINRSLMTVVLDKVSLVLLPVLYSLVASFRFAILPFGSNGSTPFQQVIFARSEPARTVQNDITPHPLGGRGGVKSVRRCTLDTHSARVEVSSPLTPTVRHFIIGLINQL